MDMIDILGGMLGQKTSQSGSKGGDILKDIFGLGRAARFKTIVDSHGGANRAKQSKELEGHAQRCQRSSVRWPGKPISTPEQSSLQPLSGESAENAGAEFRFGIG